MTGSKLRPILGESVDVRVHSGRYKVQLDIPKGSTLTGNEIERILRLSSWEVNPSTANDGYEGARSILLRREKGIVKGDIELGGLQVSGIGSRKFKFEGGGMNYEGKFSPPSTINFIARMQGTAMSTSRACAITILTTRPEYRAMGTYIAPELEEKILKTNEISKIELDSIVVPHVEAYGRYLDQELGNREGQFGFVIFPVPDPKIQRASSEAMNEFYACMRDGKSQQPVFEYYRTNALHMAALVHGLAELHDKARRAHLQTHMENYYFVGGKIYLADWATMTRLEGNSEENIVNRCIDLKRPADDYERVFYSVFHDLPREYKLKHMIHIRELTMEVYSGNPNSEIDFLAVGEYHIKKQGLSDINEFEALALWMKAEGKEGFEKRPEQYLGAAKPKIELPKFTDLDFLRR